MLPEGMSWDDVPGEVVPPPSVFRMMHADLFKVPPSCDAKMVYTMLRKICKFMGVSDWLAEPKTPPTIKWTEVDAKEWKNVSQNLNHNIHLDIVLLQQDRGSDQCKNTTIINDAIAQSLSTLCFVRFCSQHGLHLIVKDGLALAEKVAYPNYFGALAKMALIIRSGSTFRELKKTNMPACSKTQWS